MADHPVTRYIPAGTWALVEPLFSRRGREILTTLIDFVENDAIPSEKLYHAQLSTDPSTRWSTVPPVLEKLKNKAKVLGLWNVWLSGDDFQGMAGGEGGNVSNLEYAIMAEIMGRSIHLAPQATNCSAPDTGNMEVLARFGTFEQKEKYLVPLLKGEIRSSFAMTEYGTASSDATNLHNTIATLSSPSKYILSGHKWWISGAGDPRTKMHIVVAVTDPKNPSPYKRHSLLLVNPKQRGVRVIRPMMIFGYDDAPEGHCEVVYDNVEIDAVESVVGGKEGLGRGFEMLQARLGPGRLHHCMRSLGIASRALDLLLLRVSDPSRKTFGKLLREHGTVLADIAHSRAQLDQSRLLVLAAARQIDMVGAKGGLQDIGIAKFTVPTMALQIVDRAMQVYGAQGLSQDSPLASWYAQLRTLRYADAGGPDEVHIQQIGKRELQRVEELQQRAEQVKKAAERLLRENGKERAKL
nr:acyl-CoA dehydrogenase [Cryptococcus depauperatus CBS 7855]